jgi:hypothetical protein
MGHLHYVRVKSFRCSPSPARRRHQSTPTAAPPRHTTAQSAWNRAFRLGPALGCHNLRKRPDLSQTRGSVPIAAGPSTWCVPNLGSALAAARGERTVQTRCSSRNAFELERYRTEQSLHSLRRVGGDPHECQSNSMNLSQRHAADAAPW